MAADRRLVSLATPSLFLEYEDVLKRPEQRAVSGLSLAQVDATPAALAAAIEPMEVRFARGRSFRIRATRWCAMQR
nr:hypothetical protein [uncultured Rhodopila sp.]